MYFILSIQLFFTALMTIVSVTSPAITEFEVTQIWLFVIAAITAIVLMCCLLCCKENARRAPKNYILLSFFTLCEGYVVSVICCSVATDYSNGSIRLFIILVDLIIIALSMTVIMTMGLTLYACTTKDDFTICTGLLWSLAICLLMLFIFTLIFPSKLLSIVYSVFSIFLYSIYIIVDT